MRILILFLLSAVELIVAEHPTKIIAIDENFACLVKKNCEECLMLAQCSWCPSEQKCFSKTIDADFCKGNSTDNENFGLSFEENANCLCRGNKFENATTCFPPQDTEQNIPPEGLVCSGRGKCVCGRCFCDPAPDPEHPTKMIMGEYCEFDNFSCQEGCNEGPYLINTYVDYKMGADSLADDELPKSETVSDST